MRATQFLNLMVERMDRLTGGPLLCGSGLDHEHSGVHHGLTCGYWYGRFDGCNPVGERLFPHGVMRVNERFECGGPDLLNRLESGSAEHQVTDQQDADVIKPL
jgi:hypothetical protein